MASTSKETSEEDKDNDGGGKPNPALKLAEDAYDAKFQEMQKYVPFMEVMIEKLEKCSVESKEEMGSRRESQLEKMRCLYAILSNRKQRLKVSSLEKCDSILKKLYEKAERVDKVADDGSGTVKKKTERCKSPKSENEETGIGVASITGEDSPKVSSSTPCILDAEKNNPPGLRNELLEKNDAQPISDSNRESQFEMDFLSVHDTEKTNPTRVRNEPPVKKINSSPSSNDDRSACDGRKYREASLIGSLEKLNKLDVKVKSDKELPVRNYGTDPSSLGSTKTVVKTHEKQHKTPKSETNKLEKKQHRRKLSDPVPQEKNVPVPQEKRVPVLQEKSVPVLQEKSVPVLQENSVLIKPTVMNDEHKRKQIRTAHTSKQAIPPKKHESFQSIRAKLAEEINTVHKVGTSSGGALRVLANKTANINQKRIASLKPGTIIDLMANQVSLPKTSPKSKTQIKEKQESTGNHKPAPAEKSSCILSGLSPEELQKIVTENVRNLPSPPPETIQILESVSNNGLNVPDTQFNVEKSRSSQLSLNPIHRQNLLDVTGSGNFNHNVVSNAGNSNFHTLSNAIGIPGNSSYHQSMVSNVEIVPLNSHYHQNMVSNVNIPLTPEPYPERFDRSKNSSSVHYNPRSTTGQSNTFASQRSGLQPVRNEGVLNNSWTNYPGSPKYSMVQTSVQESPAVVQSGMLSGYERPLIRPTAAPFNSGQSSGAFYPGPQMRYQNPNQFYPGNAVLNRTYTEVPITNQQNLDNSSSYASKQYYERDPRRRSIEKPEDWKRSSHVSSDGNRYAQSNVTGSESSRSAYKGMERTATTQIRDPRCSSSERMSQNLPDSGEKSLKPKGGDIFTERKNRSRWDATERSSRSVDKYKSDRSLSIDRYRSNSSGGDRYRTDKFGSGTEDRNRDGYNSTRKTSDRQSGRSSSSVDKKDEPKRKDIFSSPLDSLYSDAKGPVTGRGYGIQHFKIPKLKKKETEETKSNSTGVKENDKTKHKDSADAGKVKKELSSVVDSVEGKEGLKRLDFHTGSAENPAKNQNSSYDNDEVKTDCRESAEKLEDVKINRSHGSDSIYPEEEMYTINNRKERTRKSIDEDISLSNRSTERKRKSFEEEISSNNVDIERRSTRSCSRLSSCEANSGKKKLKDKSNLECGSTEIKAESKTVLAELPRDGKSKISDVPTDSDPRESSNLDAEIDSEKDRERGKDIEVEKDTKVDNNTKIESVTSTEKVTKAGDDTKTEKIMTGLKNDYKDSDRQVNIKNEDIEKEECDKVDDASLHLASKNEGVEKIDDMNTATKTIEKDSDTKSEASVARKEKKKTEDDSDAEPSASSESASELIKNKVAQELIEVLVRKSLESGACKKLIDKLGEKLNTMKLKKIQKIIDSSSDESEEEVDKEKALQENVDEKIELGKEKVSSQENVENVERKTEVDKEKVTSQEKVENVERKPESEKEKVASQEKVKSAEPKNESKSPVEAKPFPEREPEAENILSEHLISGAAENLPKKKRPNRKKVRGRRCVKRVNKKNVKIVGKSNAVSCAKKKKEEKQSDVEEPEEMDTDKPKNERKKKNKNELDKLHEDIRDMFISSQVVSATGIRTCRLRNLGFDSVSEEQKSKSGSRSLSKGCNKKEKHTEDNEDEETSEDSEDESNEPVLNESENTTGESNKPSKSEPSQSDQDKPKKSESYQSKVSSKKSTLLVKQNISPIIVVEKSPISKELLQSYKKSIIDAQGGKESKKNPEKPEKEKAEVPTKRNKILEQNVDVCVEQDSKQAEKITASPLSEKNVDGSETITTADPAAKEIDGNEKENEGKESLESNLGTDVSVEESSEKEDAVDSKVVKEGGNSNRKKSVTGTKKKVKRPYCSRIRLTLKKRSKWKTKSSVNVTESNIRTAMNNLLAAAANESPEASTVKKARLKAGRQTKPPRNKSTESRNEDATKCEIELSDVTVNENDIKTEKVDGCEENIEELEKEELKEETPSSENNSGAVVIKGESRDIFTDKEYYQAAYVKSYECKICNYIGKTIVRHYVNDHGDHDVLVSRLSESAAKKAVLEASSSATMYSRASFKCYMCPRICTNVFSFYDHVTSHTGEYRYHCLLCNFGAPNRHAIKSHCTQAHPQMGTFKNCVSTDNASDVKFAVYGYICSECNFVQLNLQNVEEHVINHHRDCRNNVKPVRINMSEDLRTYNPLTEKDAEENEVIIKAEPAEDDEQSNASAQNAAENETKIVAEEKMCAFMPSSAEKNGGNDGAHEKINTMNETMKYIENRSKIRTKTKDFSFTTKLLSDKENGSRTEQITESTSDNTPPNTNEEDVETLQLSNTELVLEPGSENQEQICIVNEQTFTTLIDHEKHGKLNSLINRLTYKDCEHDRIDFMNVSDKSINRVDSLAKRVIDSNFSVTDSVTVGIVMVTRRESVTLRCMVPFCLYKSTNLEYFIAHYYQKHANGTFSEICSKCDIEFPQIPDFDGISRIKRCIEHALNHLIQSRNKPDVKQPNIFDISAETSDGSNHPPRITSPSSGEQKQQVTSPATPRPPPMLRVRRLSGDKLSKTPSNEDSNNISGGELMVSNSERNSEDSLGNLKIESVMSLATCDPTTFENMSLHATSSEKPLLFSNFQNITSSPIVKNKHGVHFMPGAANVPARSLLKVTEPEAKWFSPSKSGLVGRSPPLRQILPKTTVAVKRVLPRTITIDVKDVAKKLRQETNPMNALVQSYSDTKLPTVSKYAPASHNVWQHKFGYIVAPIIKDSDTYKKMLVPKKLRHLFKCMEKSCSFTCETAKKFAVHCVSHTSVVTTDLHNMCRYEWRCSYCEAILKLGVDLCNHILEKHYLSLYQCAFCFYRAFSVSNVILHQNLSHIAKNIEILKCNQMALHAMNVPEVPRSPLRFMVVLPYICEAFDNCSQKTYVTSAFEAHVRAHKILLYPCKMCSGVISVKNGVTEHFKTHQMGLYQCLYCIYGTDGQEEMRCHLCENHPDFPPKAVLRVNRQVPDNYNSEEYNPALNPFDTPLDDLKECNFDDQDVPHGCVSNPPSNNMSEVPGCEEQKSEKTATVTQQSNERSDRARESGQRRKISQNASDGLVLDETTGLLKFSLEDCAVSDALKVVRAPSKKASSQCKSVKGKSRVQTKIPPILPSCYLLDTAKFLFPDREDKSENKMSLSPKSDDSDVIILDDDDDDDQPSGIVPENTRDVNRSLVIPTSPFSFEPDGLKDARNTGNTGDGGVQAAKRKENLKATVCVNQTANRSKEALNVNESTPEPEKAGSILTRILSNPNRTEMEEVVCLSSVDDIGIFCCGFKFCTFSCRHGTRLLQHIQSCENIKFNKSMYCKHCNKEFRKAEYLVEHLRDHADLRFACSLCGFLGYNEDKLKGHMRLNHQVTYTTFNPVNPEKTDLQKDLFIILPDQKDVNVGVSIAEQTEKEKKTHFSMNEVDQLPNKPIFDGVVSCQHCNFSTKVLKNMQQHLNHHASGQPVLTKMVVNPVPCLEKNEKMFDKMINLAGSTHLQPSKKLDDVADTKELPQYVCENERYKCHAEGCTSVTVDDAMLRHHIKTLHYDEVYYRCPHCANGAGNEVLVEKLGNHLKLHDSRLYKCVHCMYHHNQRHYVERHLNEKHPEKKPFVHVVREPESDEKRNPDETGDETPAASGEKPLQVSAVKRWQCNLCKVIKATESAIKKHCGSVHGINHHYKCGLCDYKTDGTQYLFKHFMSQHPTVQVKSIALYEKCDVIDSNSPCSEPGPSVSRMTSPLWQRDWKRVKHIRGILLDENPHRQKVNRVPEMLEEEGKFGPYGQPYGNYFLCPRCKAYKTSYKNDMILHLYRELDYKFWKCGYCDKTEISRHYVARHIVKVHAGNKELIHTRDSDEEIELWVRNAVLRQQYLMKVKEVGSPLGPEDSSLPPSKKSPGWKMDSDPEIGSERIISRRNSSSRLEVDEPRTENVTAEIPIQPPKAKYARPAKWACGYCNMATVLEKNLIKHQAKKHPTLPPLMNFINRMSVQPVTGNPVNVQVLQPQHQMKPVESDLEVTIDIFECSLCGLHGRVKDLSAHHKIAHPNSIFKITRLECDKFCCGYCDSIMMSSDLIKYHCLCQHPNLPINYKIFRPDSSSSSSKKPTDLHGKPTTVTSDPTSKSVETESTVTNELTYHCSSCSFTFRKQTDMFKHLQSHMKYKCTVCEQNFDGLLGCRTHIKDAHNFDDGHMLAMLSSDLPVTVPHPKGTNLGPSSVNRDMPKSGFIGKRQTARKSTSSLKSQLRNQLSACQIYLSTEEVDNDDDVDDSKIRTSLMLGNQMLNVDLSQLKRLININPRVIMSDLKHTHPETFT